MCGRSAVTEIMTKDLYFICLTYTCLTHYITICESDHYIYSKGFVQAAAVSKLTSDLCDKPPEMTERGGRVEVRAHHYVIAYCSQADDRSDRSVV